MKNGFLYFLISLLIFNLNAQSGINKETLQKLSASPNPTNGQLSLNQLDVGTYKQLTLDGSAI
jgi:hypothetical protein